jgi:hypothetical protein
MQEKIEVIKLNCKKIDGKDDVVVSVDWKYTLSDGTEEVSTIIPNNLIITTDIEDFILFEKLTEEKVIRWINLNHHMESIKLFAEKALDEKKNPTYKKDLPWGS